MADIAVTKVALVLDARSDDILDAGGVAIATAASNQFVYTPTAGQDISRVLFKFLADASGDTVVFQAGDRPPSQRRDGTLSIVLAASDVRYVVIEIGKYLKSDGTIIIDAGDDGTTAIAFELPKVT